MQVLHQRVLSAACYQEYPALREDQLEAMMRRYCRLCSNLGEALGDEALSKTLISDARSVGARGVVAKMQFTIKTHKPQSKIVPRPIHSTINNPFSAAMRWVAGELRTWLKSKPYLLKDSQQLAQELSSLVVPPGSRLIKYDVTDVFLGKCYACRLPSFCIEMLVFVKIVLYIRRNVHIITYTPHSVVYNKKLNL